MKAQVFGLDLHALIGPQTSMPPRGRECQQAGAGKYRIGGHHTAGIDHRVHGTASGVPSASVCAEATLDSLPAPEEELPGPQQDEAREQKSDQVGPSQNLVVHGDITALIATANPVLLTLRIAPHTALTPA